jgi:hypothetical protein
LKTKFSLPVSHFPGGMSSVSPPPPSLPRPPPPPAAARDLDKPAVPYTLDQTFTVRRHIPPPPFLQPYPNPAPPRPANLQELTQLEHCLSRPPLEGSTCDDVLSLTITKELFVCDERGAQVVVVNDELVAKIYDPLFYPPYRDGHSRRSDVVMWADYDYSREAAAYNELRGPFEGKIIPKYHGSWTCDVTVDTPWGPWKRPVRLILMEFINGVRMLDLDPEKLTEEQRANIMVKAIDAERAISFHGVSHRDFSPRNIICSGNGLGGAELRVAIIDFNVSVVRRLASFPIPKKSSHLPVSPIKCWWSLLGEFAEHGWVPDPVDEMGEWLWKHWGGSPLYQPVVRGEEGA